MKAHQKSSYFSKKDHNSCVLSIRLKALSTVTPQHFKVIDIPSVFY